MQSPVILQASSQALSSQENEAQHWEPLAFRGCQRYTQLLVALFNCCYAWIFHDPRIFRVTKRIRISMSINNACQQLGQVPVALSVPGAWWLSLQPRRGHLFSQHLPQRWAHRRHRHVSERQAKAGNHCFCSFLFVPLPFCPFTFTSCQSRLPEQIQAKFCNYQ